MNSESAKGLLRFNIRRQSLALADPPISVKSKGGCTHSGPCA